MRDTQGMEALGVWVEKACLVVSLLQHSCDLRRSVIASAADHDQLVRRVLAGERPNVFGPCISVDTRKVDAEVPSILVAPLALHDEGQVSLAIDVTNMPVDNAVVDDVAPILFAEADKLPLDMAA